MTSPSVPIRHLRAQGAYLHKRSTPEHLTLVSAKGDVDEIPEDRVNEAFGVDNWPHLLHLLAEGDEALQQRVLRAMVHVYELPREAAMCLRLGLMDLLAQTILSPNAELQCLGAEVLSVLLRTAAGRAEFQSTAIPTRILPVFMAAASASSRTAEHLYDGCLELTRSFVGAQCLTNVGYLPVVMEHLRQRRMGPDLRLRVLQLLKQLVNDGQDGTVFRALELEAVGLCAGYIQHRLFELRVAACEALGALGVVDKAKRAAVDQRLVPQLCGLLTDGRWQVVAAALGALMVIAVNDDAKHAIVQADGLQTINQLLQSPKYRVQLNTAQLLAVIASAPAARRQLNVAATEFHLRSLIGDSDPLLAKTARHALQAVQWQP